MTRKMLVVGAMLLAAVAAGFGTIPLAHADDLQGQTRQDFIDALAPRTRGLSVTTEQPQAQAQPQKDMRIQFEFGSAALTPSARQVLDELGAALQSNELSEFQFSLVGHTDAVGTDEANLSLSEERAQAVKDYLVGQFQIDPVRLEASGVGEADLADPGDPSNGVNRRVVITNIGS
jgi:outer membrane protein OmpA-like peptidoglycan-associated protein